MKSGWTVSADQRTPANFKASDLQIAKATVSSNTLSADLTHKMGLLAGSIPAQATADDVITYNGNTYNSSASGEKWTRVTAQCTTIAWNASTTFTSSTNKPYNTGSTLYYVAKPTDATISISASAGTQLYAWSVSGEATTVSTANTYKTFTIATPDYSNAYNKKIWLFSYSGTGQQWVAPVAGTYTMECWGATGGESPNSGSAKSGVGGYTKGDISLSANNTLYFYVGATGANTNKSIGGQNAGGWNGGGYTTKHKDVPPSAGGGGATDIRLKLASSTLTIWNEASSLRTRIMVAGGGGGCGYKNWKSSGGSSYIYIEMAGCGGGLVGEPGSLSNSSTIEAASLEDYGHTNVSPGGAQNEVVAFERSSANESVWHGSGGFGYASQTYNDDSFNCWGGSGGGGWYGGYKGWGNGGGGGSSFILGHVGCNPVNPTASMTTHYGTSTKSITYGGRSYTFSNTQMIDGDGYLWNSASISRVYQDYNNPGVPKIGNTVVSKPGVPTKPVTTGNGYARITYTKP